MNTSIPSIPVKKHRLIKRWWFWVLVVVAVVVAISVAASLWSANSTDAAAYDYLRESVKVERRDLSRVISASGTLVADYSTTLVAPVSGTVTELPFGVGDEVKKNDVLVRFDANVPVSSSAEQVKAPFDGRVVGISTAIGGVATVGMPVVEVAFNSSHVEFFASEQEVLDLAEGQYATVVFPAYRSGRDVFTGAVSVVDVQKQSASLQTQGQAADSGYLVKVSVDELPAELRAHLGLTVDVEVTSAELPQALALQNGAIQYNDDGSTYVFELPTVDDAFIARARITDDTATLLTKRPVTVGFEGDQYTEVTSGVSEGDAVLLYIPQRAGLN